MINSETGELMKENSYDFGKTDRIPAWPSSIASFPLGSYIATIQKLKELYVFDRYLNVLQILPCERHRIPINILTCSNIDGNFLLLHFNSKLDKKSYLSFNKVIYE